LLIYHKTLHICMPPVRSQWQKLMCVHSLIKNWRNARVQTLKYISARGWQSIHPFLPIGRDWN